MVNCAMWARRNTGRCVVISLLRILGAGGGKVGYWGAVGGWVDWKKGGTLHGLQIHRDVNPQQGANLPKYLVVVMLLCCYVVGCT
jgi:hypothetical protein